MINYKDTPVELVPGPVALDNAIQQVQQKLAASLPWLQKAFGRATLQVRRLDEAAIKNKQARNEVVYPEGYYKREPFNLMPNDNFRSYCFFYPTEAVEFKDWEPFTMEAGAEQPVAIIFWANLQKVDKTKKHDFSEELKMDVVKAVKMCSGFELREIMSGYKDAFQPFTITEEYRQYVKPPCVAFRLVGVLRFDYFKC